MNSYFSVAAEKWFHSRQVVVLCNLENNHFEIYAHIFSHGKVPHQTAKIGAWETLEPFLRQQKKNVTQTHLNGTFASPPTNHQNWWFPQSRGVGSDLPSMTHLSWDTQKSHDPNVTRWSLNRRFSWRLPNMSVWMGERVRKLLLWARICSLSHFFPFCG